MPRQQSQTRIIGKNGHRVSITPNEIKSGDHSYRVYRIRTTILGKRITQTAKTLKQAEKKANALLGQLKAKGGVIATYSPEEVAVIEAALKTVSEAKVSLTQAVTQYSEAARHLPSGVSLVEAVRGYAAKLAKETIKPITVTALVKKYKESIKGTSLVHQNTIGPRLDRAAEHFRCNISDITAGHVDEWLKGLAVGPLTRNHHRVALSSLMRFAQIHDHLSDGLTAADKIRPLKKPEKAIEAYTPTEALFLLQNIESRWRPYIALGLFAGIRPQETFNLDWSDIKTSHIEVRASGSKVGIRRIVPRLPALSAWIRDHREKEGPVCPEFKGGDASRQQSISKAIRDVVDRAHEVALIPKATKAQKGLRSMKVIYDGLRHSYISYRLAVVKDLPQVALEAGNSVEIIQRHYNKRVTEKEAKAFFGLTPESLT